MTPYSEIFSLALQKYQDFDLAQWPEEDLSNELWSHLQTAIRNLPQLRMELMPRDAFDVEDPASCGFTNDLSDVVKEALALGMVRAWLSPQIKSTTLTLQRFSKKEGYSQREFLNGLMILDGSIKNELKKLLRDNSYVDNEYFEG